MLQLPESVKIISKEGNKGVFEIGPLMPGYGATIANPLRRVLLASLEGAAITTIKMKGVEHEFSAIEGVYEDVIEIISNLKKIRFKSFSQEPVKATLEVHGDKEITAKDIKLPTDVELINPDQYILTLTDKKSSISMEIEIEKGVGYVPVEQRQKEKLAIGMIAIDAIFSPVKLVNFKIEDTRVGQRIDFNKITMEVETDGSMEPELALKKASDILSEHFQVISEINVPEPESDSPKPAKKAPKAKKKDAK